MPLPMFLPIRTPLVETLFLFLQCLVFAQDASLLAFLNEELPGTEITELESSDHFVQEYEILIPQMLDHKDPKAGTFNQRIFLSHYDVNSPILMVTEGYAARKATYEIAEKLKTNQIIVEYRFFGKSVPEEKDWQYLKNRQAMSDLHRIHLLFSKYYKNKNWITTGISKGGTTCLMYKATYPKDARIAIPYVGPMPLSPTDKRMDNHLASVGSKSCRDKLINVQIRSLEQRNQIIPKLDSLAKKRGIKFSMGTGKALEYSVLELSFSFWQYAHDCAKIPINGSPEENFKFISSISGFDLYADKTIEYYAPAFYQFITENGYYGFLHGHLDEYIQDLTVFDNSYFAPKDTDLTYNPKFMLTSVEKLRRKKRILQIHGGLDPWSAVGLSLEGKEQYYFVKEGGGHTTRIASFSEDTQTDIWSIIMSWLK